MSERLRKIEHAEAQVIDTGKRREVARDLQSLAALDHEAHRDAVIARLHVIGLVADALAILRATRAERACAERREVRVLDDALRLVDRLDVRGDDPAHAAIEITRDRR